MYKLFWKNLSFVLPIRRECVGRFLFVVANSDVVMGWGEGTPRDVEPAGAGKNQGTL